MQNWIVIKSFSNQIQAEIAKSVLEGAGIISKVQIKDSTGGPYLGASLGGTGHFLGTLPLIMLIVPQEQAQEAQKLLEGFKN